MKELSLHILDIIQNSITAKASFIEIKINEDLVNDTYKIEISDNGIGMDEEFLKKVLDPFTTTRLTRKVGLGLPLFQASTLQCDGNFEIKSEVEVGTSVKAVFKHSHIDRPPLGNVSDTIITCIMANNKIDYLYEHKYNKNKFIFDTREVKKKIGDMPITDIEIISWIKEYIKENISGLVKT